jgi:hypothetical protein
MRAWDVGSNDLVLLRRGAIECRACDGRLQSDNGRNCVPWPPTSRLDFVEARQGMRQFLFALRRGAATGADPFRQRYRWIATRSIARSKRSCDSAYRRRQSIARYPGRIRRQPARRGRVTAIDGQSWKAWPGEPLIATRRRAFWALGNRMWRRRPRVTDALKPGDHVVVTGPRAWGITAHRLTLASLAAGGWRCVAC